MKILHILALVLVLAACHNPDSCSGDLRRREKALARELDSLLILRDVIGRDQLRSGLQQLRAREVVLLDDARQCDFGFDRVNQHYWQRGRLKLPSRIELAIERLDEQ